MREPTIQLAFHFFQWFLQPNPLGGIALYAFAFIYIYEPAQLHQQAVGEESRRWLIEWFRPMDSLSKIGRGT